jgi:hypothetical protein
VFRLFKSSSGHHGFINNAKVYIPNGEAAAEEGNLALMAGKVMINPLKKNMILLK